jgi:hypothetical protein
MDLDVIVHQGRVTGLIDFAEAVAQPADVELDTLLRWCARAREYPPTPEEQGLDEKRRETESLACFPATTISMELCGSHDSERRAIEQADAASEAAVFSSGSICGSARPTGGEVPMTRAGGIAEMEV